MKRMRGRPSSSVAMLSRFSSPPLRPRSVSEPTAVFHFLSSPSKAASALRCASLRSLLQSAGSLHAAVHVRCSPTVSFSKKMSFCIEYATDRFHAGGAGRPLIITVPDHRPLAPRAGRSARILSNVVLPAPLGPMRASSSPGRASPEIPWHTCFSWAVAAALSSVTNASTSRQDRVTKGDLPLAPAAASQSSSNEASIAGRRVSEQRFDPFAPRRRARKGRLRKDPGRGQSRCFF